MTFVPQLSKIPLASVALLTLASFTFIPAQAAALQEDHKLVMQSGGPENDAFGKSVAVSGDTMVVGADEYDFDFYNIGTAFVYRFNGTDWIEEAKIDNPEPAFFGNQFGKSVAIQGDTLVIGDLGNETAGEYAGAAHVYTRTGNLWAPQAKLVASDAASYDLFGDIVRIDGDTIAVGARGDDNYKGAVYVFERNGSAWTQQAKLTGSNSVDSDVFGLGISLNGDSIVVGAPNHNIYGAAYVYTRGDGSWPEQAVITPTGVSTYVFFGSSVAIHGDRLAVGSHGDGEFNGAVYVYNRNGVTWTQDTKLTASDTAASDRFGYAVAMNDTDILVGAYGQNTRTGAAYLYKHNGTTWDEVGKMVGSDTATESHLGVFVDLDNDAIILGSYNDAAYVFNLPLNSVTPPPPPPPVIDPLDFANQIIQTSNACVSSGGLVEATSRGLKKWNSNLNATKRLISRNRTADACVKINTLLLRSDGQNSPTDWVSGTCLTPGNDPDLIADLNTLKNSLNICQ